MISLGTFWSFIKCIPELVALIRALEAAADEAEKQRELKKNVKTIGDAFAQNDPAKLHALFNGDSVPVDSKTPGV